MSAFRTVGVIGAGAWGTALAQVCARAGMDVLLWAREPEVVEAVNGARQNTLFLPGVTLHGAVRATGDLTAMAVADLLLAVVPAQHMRATLTMIGAHLPVGQPVVLCAKGIEQGSLKMMSQVLSDVAPQARAAVLSGPSFAADVSRGLPTAVTLACADAELGHALATALALPSFRPYWTHDVIGAEAGGAVKNVLAIAVGVLDGLAARSDGSGPGLNARAALITRGLAEMTRLGVALGARPETFMGLSGLGDLVLTATGDLSRNRRVGLLLAAGRELPALLSELGHVAEGVYSADTVLVRARAVGVEMPIAEAVNDLVQGRLAPLDALQRLMSREARPES